MKCIFYRILSLSDLYFFTSTLHTPQALFEKPGEVISEAFSWVELFGLMKYRKNWRLWSQQNHLAKPYFFARLLKSKRYLLQNIKNKLQEMITISVENSRCSTVQGTSYISCDRNLECFIVLIEWHESWQYLWHLICNSVL